MDKSACLCKQLKWNEFPIYSDTMSWKIVHRTEIVTQRVWGNHLRGTKSPDKAPSCLEKILRTKDRKTKAVETYTKCRKETPIYGNRCGFHQKRKGCPHKAGVNRLKSKRAASCYSETSFFKKGSQQQQLDSSSYQRTQPLAKFFINTCLRSYFIAQLRQNCINFPLVGSDVQIH